MKRVVTGLYEDNDVELMIDTKKMIGSCYWAVTNDGRHCLIQKDLKVVTPFINRDLVGSLTANNYKDICLILKSDNEAIPLYYHFKEIDGVYKNVFSTDTKGDTFFRMIESDFDEYWLIETLSGKQSIYSIEKGKQITPFFDKIEFVDSSTHLAFVSKDVAIIPEDEEEEYSVSALVGFVDYDGNFSSRLYDTELKKYFVIKQAGSQGILEFLTLCENLADEHKLLSLEKTYEVDDIIQELFEEKLERKIVPKQKTKVYEFKKREW